MIAERRLGVGQVTALYEGVAEVTYFGSVLDPVAHRENVAVTLLRPIILERQRRCYVHQADAWIPGRILAHEHGRYHVKLPGDRTVWLGPQEFRVRWNRPPGDPVDDLIGRWWSHPRGVEERADFLVHAHAQRVAAAGLTGVTSLVVEPHAHQVEVARRVLDDPVGRFLLADEVGLGKTIEALMVIRQFVLDDPESRVRIVVPAHLQTQWQSELLQKAGIDAGRGDRGDFPWTNVHVCALGAREAWAAHEALDLLVVDEAHRIAAYAHAGATEQRTQYAAAQRLTQSTECVLLLSATPSLEHDVTYLALLHLLDPERHDITNVSRFRQRLADMDRVASALLALDPEDPAAIIIDALDDLAAALPAEAHQIADIRAVRDPLAAGGTLPAATVDALKLQIAEAFRLDRRMLRTRRDAVRRRFPVRGRRCADPLEAPGHGFANADEWYERWRSAVLSDVQDNVAGSQSSIQWLASLFAEFVIGAPGLVPALARLRLGQATKEDRNALGLSGSPTALVTGCEMGAQERGELERAPELGGPVPTQYADAIADAVWSEYRQRDNIVVLSSHRAVAQQIADRLAEALRPEELQSHLRGSAPAANTQALERFIATDHPCHVLVCDASAQEGLNLQSADVVLLADVPLGAAALEQRLGRFDRFSHRGPIQIRAIEVTHDARLRATWMNLLETRYRIFDRSVAALQVPIADLQPALGAALLARGASGLASCAQTIEDRLTRGQQELTRSELLDSGWVDEMGTEIAQRLSDDDTAWATWRSTADGLLADGLRLIRWRHSDDVLSYWLEHPRIRAIEPELDGRARADLFIDAMSDEGRVRRVTYDRSVALAHPGVRVLRVGHPLIDAAQRYLTEYDDARVSVTWRKTAVLPDGRAHVGLGMTYLADLPVAPLNAGGPRMAAVLRRRIESWFLPASTTLWVTTDGAVLDEDDDLAVLLAFTFDGPQGDRALYAPHADAVRALVPGDWERTLRDIAGHAHRVATDRLVTQQHDRWNERLHHESARRLAVLRGRDTPRSTLDREAIGTQRLGQAIADAGVRLAGIRLVVLSDDDPAPNRRGSS